MINHPARPMESRHFELRTLGPAVAVGAAAVLREAIQVSGNMRARVRVKLSVIGGTFAFKFIRPDSKGNFPTDGTNAHATDNPADLVVGATAEVSREFDLYGEGVLLIEYTDDGDGSTIEYVTVSLL